MCDLKFYGMAVRGQKNPKDDSASEKHVIIKLDKHFVWIGENIESDFMGDLYQQEWATNQFPLFSQVCSLVKSHASHWVSPSYLTGVVAAEFQWHLSNMNLIRGMWTVENIHNGQINGFLVTPTQKCQYWPPGRHAISCALLCLDLFRRK